ncbi:MAG: hypothetical protein WCK10_03805 [Candidatus Staskawiczbacteria bacterium]
MNDYKNYQISLTDEEKRTLINLDEEIRTLLYDLGKLDIQFDTYKNEFLLQIADKKSRFDGIILDKVMTLGYQNTNDLNINVDMNQNKLIITKTKEQPNAKRNNSPNMGNSSKT